MTQPDSPTNLLHVLGIIAARERPALGIWNPGPFAIKHADEFLRVTLPGPDHLERRTGFFEAVRRRAARFFADATETRFTAQRFCERWNEFADKPARRYEETPPDEIEILTLKMQAENRARIERENAAKADKAAP